MSCCGSRRQAHKAWFSPRPARLRYSGGEPMKRTGIVTGNLYEFSAGNPEREVDARDAVEFLKTPDFALVTEP